MKAARRDGAARPMSKRWRGPFVVALLALACARARSPATASSAEDPLAPARVARLRAFIHATWPALTRTPADLPAAARDDKVPHRAQDPWPVYVPSDENLDAFSVALERVLPPGGLAAVVLRPLPAAATPVAPPGLLYLPHPYVVPGGRFNEMYGWDSAFIVIGLLREGQIVLAREVVDDLLYEVRHYGAVLNANRTYYLTRSQPPLLSEMVLAIYRATSDRAWLAEARQALETTYAHWTSPPHLVAGLGLSRYFDHGAGPAPE